jgi:uncharacterized membrane protein
MTESLESAATTLQEEVPMTKALRFSTFWLALALLILASWQMA